MRDPCRELPNGLKFLRLAKLLFKRHSLRDIGADDEDPRGTLSGVELIRLKTEGTGRFRSLSNRMLSRLWTAWLLNTSYDSGAYVRREPLDSTLIQSLAVL